MCTDYSKQLVFNAHKRYENNLGLSCLTQNCFPGGAHLCLWHYKFPSSLGALSSEKHASLVSQLRASQPPHY